MKLTESILDRERIVFNYGLEKRKCSYDTISAIFPIVNTIMFNPYTINTIMFDPYTINYILDRLTSNYIK